MYPIIGYRVWLVENSRLRSVMYWNKYLWIPGVNKARKYGTDIGPPTYVTLDVNKRHDVGFYAVKDIQDIKYRKLIDKYLSLEDWINTRGEDTQLDCVYGSIFMGGTVWEGEYVMRSTKAQVHVLFNNPYISKGVLHDITDHYKVEIVDCPIDINYRSV